MQDASVTLRSKLRPGMLCAFQARNNSDEMWLGIACDIETALPIDRSKKDPKTGKIIERIGT